MTTSLPMGRAADVFNRVSAMDIDHSVAWAERPSGFTPGKVVPALVHRPSGSEFVFDVDESERLCHTFTTPREDTPHHGRVSRWSRQLATLEDWLTTTCGAERSHVEYQPRRTPENISIKARLELAASAGRQRVANDGGFRSVMSDIAPKDWILLVVGIVASQTLQLLLTPSRADEISNSVRAFLTSMFQYFRDALGSISASAG